MTKDDRIESIDAIRGVALFGVLIVNLITGFRVSIFQQFLPSSAVGLDFAVERIVAVGIESKAFCLFALIFGVGLAIQFERLSGTGRPLYWLARRLAVLLVFGLIHLLFIWNGDILTEYALAGFIVLPLLLLRPSALLAAALAFLTLYAVGPALYTVPWPDAAALQAHVTAANRAYSTGSFAETLRFSHEELPLILSLHLWVLPRTLALFVFGIFLWRIGFLTRAASYAEETGLAAVAGIAAGAALTAADAVMASVVLALGYGAALLLLAQRPRLSSLFSPIGRMAFTNYVLQSVIFASIFFGYGLGWCGRMGAAAAVLLGMAVFAAQLVLSKWWLRRYRYGPIEWLWRTLMHGVAQPMRRAA